MEQTNNVCNSEIIKFLNFSKKNKIDTIDTAEAYLEKNNNLKKIIKLLKI